MSNHDLIRRVVARYVGAGKATLPLKSLPPSVAIAMRSTGMKMPRDVQVQPTIEAFRHYPHDERLFDLDTGKILDAPTEMPADFRGDEDYFVAAKRLLLKDGQGYASNSGSGYATLQVTPSDAARLTAVLGEIPEVSKQEYQALDSILGTVAKGRPRVFQMRDLGPYEPENPYIKSLQRKGLLRGLAPTAMGKTVRQQAVFYKLPDQPLR